MEFISAFLGLLLVYYLQRFLYRQFWNVKLKAELEFSKNRAVEGEKVVLQERIINRKILPIPMLYFKFKVSRYLKFDDSEQREVTDYFNRSELFSMLMYQKITRRLPFICGRRGVYDIKTAYLVGSGLLLTEEYLEEIATDTRLIVYPKCVNLKLFQHRFETLFGDIATQRFMNEDPFAFRGIREYNSTDSMRKVNWKASAKTLDWKVNLYEYTVQQKVELYVNLQWQNLISEREVLEESIRLAKTFAWRFYQMGLSVNLYTNGLHFETKEPIVLENIGKEKFLNILDESLAKIKLMEEPSAKVDTEFNAPDFCEMYKERLMKTGEEHYRILISNYQHTDFQDMLLELKKSGKNISWIIPSGDGKKPEYLREELRENTFLWKMQWEEVESL